MPRSHRYQLTDYGRRGLGYDKEVEMIRLAHEMDHITGCEQLNDLSPLANLTSLQELCLSGCGQLSDLSPLVDLISLKKLDLSGCIGSGKFASLEALVSVLQSIHLFGCQFDDLPSEICGQDKYENVIGELRAHIADLQSGQFHDAELKLFILGNGGVGKTQLSRRL